MKKIFSLLLVAGAISIISCGPSAEEKAKIDALKKAKMDSLFNAASKSITNSMDSVSKTKPDSLKGVKK